MMTRLFLGHTKRYIFCLLIMCFSSVAIFSQPGTIINKYARVLSRSVNQVFVDDVTPFKIAGGDTVLIIQMQGVAINAADALGYGTTIEQKVGIPGRYEFLITQSVVPAAGTTGTITFFTNINKYDPAGNVQIIKVPSYNSLSNSDVLTCKQWDRVTKTGGVLAMIVGKTLTLNKNIDVSGKGFTGGKDTIGTGDCSDPSGILEKYSFPRSFLNAGYKGEGLASHQSFCPDPCIPGVLPLYLKGQGAIFSGGGGGNGKFSGGGGGSNRGPGGPGGKEFYLCSPQINVGGYPGVSVTGTIIDTITGGIFMGGGGGSSTRLTGSVSSHGGNGGGIVIIVTDQLNGNGNSILADGSNVSTAKQNAGAGGGGAGGSVIISSNSLLNVGLSVKGGKGGNHLEGFGEGGGGGGGLLWISQPAKPPSVTNTLDGGLAGIDTILVTSTALPGSPGLPKYSFKAQLNGFLFNSIRSSGSGNQLDYVCSNVLPPKITGTTPVGGTPGAGYIYTWEKSYNAAFTSPILLINDTDPVNYTPTIIETSTVYFRRTVTDHSLPAAIIDRSMPVEIIVQPAITANNIGKDTTICQGQNPLQIGSIPLNSTPANGNGIYRYKWLQNTTNTGWDTSQVALGAINDKNYDPPVLNQTTYYKRFVQSGRCIDLSSSSVKITVLYSITGNKIVPSDSIICEGSLFAPLGASTPGEGDKVSYLFQWQDSTASSSWNPASGSNISATYAPDTSKFSVATQKRFYRRIVTSGPYNTCKLKSQPIQLTRFPKIKNNFITANPADLTICSGMTPVALPGSIPTNGAGPGSYSFVWQDSIVGSTFLPASGTNNSATGNYQPPLPLTAAHWYRRIVNSGVYKSAPVCTNTSASAKINVDPPVLNYNIALFTGGTTQTICYGQNPDPFRGNPLSGPTGGLGVGSYTYQWMSSLDNTTFNAVPTALNDIYAPLNLTATTYYRRDLTSGACKVSSNVIAITVLPLITNNVISGNGRVCDSLAPGPVTGALLSGGSGTYKYSWEQSTDGGTNWTSANGTNTSADYQAPKLYTATEYRRTVISGLNDCCSSISNSFDIVIDPLPVRPIYAGPPATIYSIDKIYHMQAINPGLVGETGTWSVLDNGQSTIDDTTKFNTIVRNLSSRVVNSFLWTVHRGPCKLSDSVNIKLNEDFEPRAFSPNGDGTNDTFIVEGLDKEDNWVDLKIVNGAGTEVFTTTNRNGQKFDDWNGKNSKGLDLPEGTYYYMLKITPKDGTSTSKKSGFIILKRY
jgi:gliding motility-associated-like protein